MNGLVSNERENNRKTVEYFFTIGGTKRLEIYHEDGVKELPFLPETLRSAGAGALRAHHESTGAMFPDWKWSDVRIFSTENPKLFFATANGSGSLVMEGRSAHYENSYVFMFEMRDGKIALLKEYNNPLPLLKAAGVKLAINGVSNEVAKHFANAL